jgi:aminoglycoside phosphotransferase (APT) family kinase protein
MEMSKLFKSVSTKQIHDVMTDTFGPGTEVKQIRLMKGGLFNTTYYVEGASPEQRLILRVAPANEEHLLSFEKNNMSVEPYIYELMTKAGIPCTQVVRYEGSGIIIDRPYMLIAFIESIQLNDPTIALEEYKELQEELGGYLRRMHDISSDTFGFPQADGSVLGSSSWSEVLIQFSTEIAGLARVHHLLEPIMIDEFQNFFVSHRLLFDEVTFPSLVHNDLWDPNVLVKRDSGGLLHIAAIIDADKAMYADREFDSILYNNDPAIMKGYGLELDMNENAIIRRKAYEMLWLFAFLYIHEIQIDLPEDATYFREKSKESFRNLVQFNM